MGLTIHRRKEPTRRNRQGLVKAGQVKAGGASVAERVDRAGRDSEELRRARLINVIRSPTCTKGCRRVHEARDGTGTEGDDAAVTRIATRREIGGPIVADRGPTTNDTVGQRRGGREDNTWSRGRRGHEAALHIAGRDIRRKRGAQGTRARRREVQRAARILGERSNREGSGTSRSGRVIKRDVEGARTCADGDCTDGLGIVLDDGRLEGEPTAIQRDGDGADTGSVAEHAAVIEDERAARTVQVNGRSRRERRLVGQGNGTTDVRHAREAQRIREGLRARTDTEQAEVAIDRTAKGGRDRRGQGERGRRARGIGNDTAAARQDIRRLQAFKGLAIAVEVQRAGVRDEGLEHRTGTARVSEDRVAATSELHRATVDHKAVGASRTREILWGGEDQRAIPRLNQALSGIRNRTIEGERRARTNHMDVHRDTLTLNLRYRDGRASQCQDTRRVNGHYSRRRRPSYPS